MSVALNTYTITSGQTVDLFRSAAAATPGTDPLRARLVYVRVVSGTLELKQSNVHGMSATALAATGKYLTSADGAVVRTGTRETPIDWITGTAVSGDCVVEVDVAG